MTGWLTRWRLALRIARRDALRAPGRTLLVLAMVGLPVLAVVAADVLYRTQDVTAAESLDQRLGAADARIEGELRTQIWADPVTGTPLLKEGRTADPPWTAAEVSAELPAGSRVIEAVAGPTVYRTDVGYARVVGLADDLTDPLRAGAVELVEGALPTADGEVAVGRAVAARGVSVGDILELSRENVPARVVGVVDSYVEIAPFVLVPPSGAALLEERRSTFYAAVPGGLDWPAVQELNRRGLVAVSREVAQDPPSAAEWAPPGMPGEWSAEGSSAGTAVLALVVATVVLEVVLLAGPAFAVGVRRQRRDLALLAASGGAPGDLRRIVLAAGAVLGGGAALLGAALGIGLARLAVPMVENRLAMTLGPFDVPWRDVAVTVAVGLVAGLGAALVPARQAARTDVVEALAGRRGQVRTSWRSPVLGLALVTAGMVLVVLGARGNEFGVAGGAVLLVVGMVAACPWLVGLLAPLARRLPVPARLAVRDATRNRARTAPAVAAVMATVAGVTALAIGSTSDSAQSRRDYVPQGPLGSARIYGPDLDAQGWTGIEAMLREEAPDRPIARISSVPFADSDQRSLGILSVGCAGSLLDCRWFPGDGADLMTSWPDTVVVDAGTVAALDRKRVPAAAVQALADGRVVVFGEGAVDERGQVTVAGARYDRGGNEELVGTVVLPAVEVPLPRADGSEPVLLPAVTIIPPALADRLPFEVQTTELVTGGPDAPVTPELQERIQQVLTALSASGGISVERGWQDELAAPRYILYALSAALVLVATLTATGLALADARPDFATLAAVGAAPRTRRLMAMGSAAVVGGAGALTGVLVGLAPGIAVSWPLTAESYGAPAEPVLVIPWMALAGVAVLVPLLAVLVTGIAVRSRLPMARRIA